MNLDARAICRYLLILRRLTTRAWQKTSIRSKIRLSLCGMACRLVCLPGYLPILLMIYLFVIVRLAFPSKLGFVFFIYDYFLNIFILNRYVSIIKKFRF